MILFSRTRTLFKMNVQVENDNYINYSFYTKIAQKHESRNFTKTRVFFTMSSF